MTSLLYSSYQTADLKGVVHMCRNAMRFSRWYACVLLNLLVFTILFFLWEQSRLNRLLENVARSCNRDADEDTPLKNRVGNRSTVHPVTISKRPLLVRFDWYSRKQTPVHIG